MKNRLCKLFFGTVLYVATANLAMCAVLSVDSSNPNVGLSSSLALDVSIKNVSNLYAYQFGIKFNPNLFNAVNVSEGPFLSNGGTTTFFSGKIDNTKGDISFVANTLQDEVGVSGQGVLASIYFQSLNQAGSGIFSINKTTLIDSSGADIDHTTSSVVVSVGVVPEPEEWVMLLLGACFVSFQVNRKKAKQGVL